MGTFTVPETMNTLNCAICAITFGIPKRFDDDRRKDHKDFYCPSGHINVYRGESEEEKLRRERDIAKQQVARAEEDAARERRKAEKAVRETKRLKKRVGAGVCPCCQRSVRQMALHMKTKHPEFVAEETTNIVPIKKKA